MHDRDRLTPDIPLDSADTHPAWQRHVCRTMPLTLSVPASWVVAEAAQHLLAASSRAALGAPLAQPGAHVSCLGGTPAAFGSLTDPVALLTLFAEGFLDRALPPGAVARRATPGDVRAAQVTVGDFRGRAQHTLLLAALAGPSYVVVVSAVDTAGGRWLPVLAHICRSLQLQL